MPALVDFVGGGRQMLLCLIRTTNTYLSKTAVACSILFILTTKKKQVSQNTILYWIRSVIAHASDMANDDYCRPVKVQVHEVCKTGTSIPLKKNSYYAVQQVLKAGTWSSQMRFSTGYLRDFTHRFMDTFPIGPVVAA